MRSSKDVVAALLSVMFPGLGQFSKGQFLRGSAFCTTALVGAIGLAVVDATKTTTFALLGALAAIGLWSVIDAYSASR